jgi:hypothetical protein
MEVALSLRRQMRTRSRRSIASCSSKLKSTRQATQRQFVEPFQILVSRPTGNWPINGNLGQGWWPDPRWTPPPQSSAADQSEAMNCSPFAQNKIAKGKAYASLVQFTVIVLYGTVFSLPFAQAVNVMKTCRRLSDAALLLSVRKEMTTPNRSKSVRDSEAKQARKGPTRLVNTAHKLPMNGP